jgi:hypothetical protein
MKKVFAASALAGAVILVGCAGGMPVTGWFDTTPAPVSVDAPPPVPYERPAPPGPVMLAPQETPAQIDARSYVKALQKGLAAKGYYTGRLDGLCGPQTRGAADNYRDALYGAPQKRVGPDCHVGDHAWSGLGMSQGGKRAP